MPTGRRLAQAHYLITICFNRKHCIAWFNFKVITSYIFVYDRFIDPYIIDTDIPFTCTVISIGYLMLLRTRTERAEVFFRSVLPTVRCAIDDLI